jgi:hypothetical protein
MLRPYPPRHRSSPRIIPPLAAPPVPSPPLFSPRTGAALALPTTPSLLTPHYSIPKQRLPGGGANAAPLPTTPSLLTPHHSPPCSGTNAAPLPFRHHRCSRRVRAQHWPFVLRHRSSPRIIPPLAAITWGWGQCCAPTHHIIYTLLYHPTLRYIRSLRGMWS